MTNGNDTIIAGLAINIIDGKAGDDLIFGYGGRDWAFGGRDDDLLLGDGGDDTLKDSS